MDAALLSSIELQAEAQFENEVIDHHHERLADAVERQERIAQAAALVSPVVAIRSLSMALAGTDYAHHRHFADAAEKHRRALVDMLNRELGDKGGADAWSYQAGRELWERAPPFRHALPDLPWLVRKQSLSLMALGAWLLFSLLFAYFSARRITVV
jgi:ABC-2 type transport system permease protein